MDITYYGHACVGIKIGDINLIVDPFISGNPLKEAKKIDVDSIKVDYILVTHAHQDHVLDVERIAKNNPNAILVSNAEIAGYFQQRGLQTHPMNHGGSWNFDFGLLRYTPAIHSSSFEDGSYGGQPGGFVIESKNKNIYIAGDTSLTFDMKLIPLFTKLDLAILPIGSNFTMDIEQGVVAAEFLECDKIMGYHYDTFGFIEIDHQQAKSKFYEKGKDLMLLKIGEKLTL